MIIVYLTQFVTAKKLKSVLDCIVNTRLMIINLALKDFE